MSLNTEENLIILQEMNGVIRQDGKSREKFIWETSQMIEDKLTELHRLKAELKN